MTTEQYISSQLATLLNTDYVSADDKNQALCDAIAKLMAQTIIPNLKTNLLSGLTTFLIPGGG